MVAATRPPVPASPTPTGPSVRLVAATVVGAHSAGALLGAVTWVLAARSLPASAVGAGVALTGVLGWCGLLANGGLGSAVVSLAPDTADAGASLVLPAAGRAAAIGAVVGAGAVAVLLAVDGPLHHAGTRPVVAAALVVGAAGTSASIVVDAAAVALGRPAVVVGRSLAFAGIRLAVLGLGTLTAADGRDLLVGGWALATVVAVAGQLVVLVGRSARPVRGTTFGLAAWGNHAVSLTAQSPGLLLPSVVAATAGPVQAGAFGAAWQVASVAALASPSMATAVFSHARRHPTALDATARRAGRDLLLVLVPVVAVVALAGPIVLGLLGPGYRDAGAVAVALVAMALLPDAVSNVVVAAWRARLRYRPALLLNATTAAVALGGGAGLAAGHGATGAAGAWLGAQVVGATVAVAVVVAHGRRPDRTAAAAT